MDVIVRFFIPVNLAAGCDQESFSFPEATVPLRRLCEVLLDRHGPRFQPYVENLQKANIFINGLNSFHMGALDAALKDGDQVAFIPPIAGGSADGSAGGSADGSADGSAGGMRS